MGYRRVIGYVSLLAVLATVALTVPASAEAARGPSFGIGDWGTLRASDLRTLGRNRIRIYRRPLKWEQIERSPGRFDFRATDTVVRRAARARVRILGILAYTPAFARAGGNANHPPRGGGALNLFARFVRVVVGRYGRGGSFWRQNRVPYRPITTLQAWNEPHLRFFWGRTPSAGEYLSLATIASRAARAVDPRIKLITASVTHSGGRGFLSSLFRQRGARGVFSGVGLNLYHRRLRSARGALRATRSFRRFLNRVGMRGKPLHITEFGWRSTRSRRSQRKQAKLVRQTVTYLRRHRRRLRLSSLFYFSYRDARYGGGFRGSYRTGLRTRGNRAKRAWFTYARLARRWSR